jgi:hypothetical protein
MMLCIKRCLAKHQLFTETTLSINTTYSLPDIRQEHHREENRRTERKLVSQRISFIFMKKKMALSIKDGLSKILVLITINAIHEN